MLPLNRRGGAGTFLAVGFHFWERVHVELANEHRTGPWRVVRTIPQLRGTPKRPQYKEDNSVCGGC